MLHTLGHVRPSSGWSPSSVRSRSDDAGHWNPGPRPCRASGDGQRAAGRHERREPGRAALPFRDQGRDPGAVRAGGSRCRRRRRRTARDPRHGRSRTAPSPPVASPPSADPAAAAAKNAGRRGCPAGCDAAARPAGGSVPSGPAAGCVDGAAEDDRRLPTVTGWRRPSSAEPPWTGGCRIDAGGSAHGCRADRGRAGLISASRGEPAENATPASGTPADRRSRHSVKPAWPPSGHGRRAATVTHPGARAPGRRPT